MAVTVQKLTGSEIPVERREDDTVAIWVVLVNGDAIKYCASEAEAIAMCDYLEEQWSEYLREHEGETHFKAPRPRRGDKIRLRPGFCFSAVELQMAVSHSTVLVQFFGGVVQVLLSFKLWIAGMQGRKDSMGKKSREKKERKHQLDRGEASVRQLSRDQAYRTRKDAAEAVFQKELTAVQAILHSYHPLDAALAISASELWPANSASPNKCFFAWRILAGLDPSAAGNRRIGSYTDFTEFTERLFLAWPSFAGLEDFVPEPDWAAVKIKLGSQYVPMFFGSTIERTPDFVESFRITQASNSLALADMDLAIAIQSYLQMNVPDAPKLSSSDINPGHTEVPSEAFWLGVSQALLAAEKALAEWRAQSSGRFEVNVGDFRRPISWDSFGNECMQGSAFPYFGIVIEDHWLPVAIRNAPGTTISAWSQQDRTPPVDAAVHLGVAKFLEDRFQKIVAGPLTLMVEGRPFDLTISCVLAPGSHIYLIAACGHDEIEKADAAAQEIYHALSDGKPWGFELPGGRFFDLRDQRKELPLAASVSVLLIVTQSSTEFGFVASPKSPTRLMFLADMVTIFDALEDIDELERFWIYADSQRKLLIPISQALPDMFASFRDVNEVLVAGAESPTMIILDPSWGSHWRYVDLAKFWANAPRNFPDHCTAWTVDRQKNGVSHIRSKRELEWACSVEVGECTAHVVTSARGVGSDHDLQMVNMFMQAYSDCLVECLGMVSELPIFRGSQLIIRCEVDPDYTIDEVELSENTGQSLVTSARLVREQPLTVGIRVNTLAIQAGLTDSKDASCEVEIFIQALSAAHSVCGLSVPQSVVEQIRGQSSRKPRYHLTVLERTIDVPDFVDPVIPTLTDYKLARRQLAHNFKTLDFSPGRYELADAKTKIDAARELLRYHLEARILSLDAIELAHRTLEQHDAVLSRERTRIMRVRQSLAHEVDYDRLDVDAEVRRELGPVARHYRYLLEKVLSSTQPVGGEPVDDNVLRELVGLVDWYMVLAGASDTLHNNVDVGGVEIDDSYIPEIFYSEDWSEREAVYARVQARTSLGLGLAEEDTVEGDLSEHLESEELRESFRDELGFDLRQLLTSLRVLSQPVAYGLAAELAFSYKASPQAISATIVQYVGEINQEEAEAIVKFLTLSATGIRRLAGRDVEEVDVPHWEHSKRIHRYAIRPLVPAGNELRWGAEHVSRTLKVWIRAIHDGYLPAEFPWPRITSSVRNIKGGIEKDLECRTEEICKRFTPYVVRGADFYRRFRKEGFDDVGDFDVLAWWPDKNLLIALECKYNQPPHTIKDTRRLRDRIFGATETDRNGQFSRILGRRQFIATHRARMLELLKWPAPIAGEAQDLELYISRLEYWWLVHPPYPIPTIFLRVDALDRWLRNQIGGPDNL